jgi:pimeloyl-ACP methyl ester carboxylesterase
VPTVILHGGDDTVGPAKRAEAELPQFPAGTERRVVTGVGHFMPREEPKAVVDALLKLLH